MGVRQKDYNPANGMALLKAALGEQEMNTTPGRTPSGIAQNAYFSSMPNTNEQEREATATDALDAGASDRYQAGLDQNKEIDMANTGAKALGFDNPRAQQEDAAMKKLQMILAPEKMKLDAANAGADEARSYATLEHDKDRQLRSDIVAAQQGGQTQRTADSLSLRDKQFQQKQASPLDKLLGMFGGGGAPAAPAGAEPTVKIQDPNTGEVRDVPQSRAQAVLAKGGIVVQ